MVSTIYFDYRKFVVIFFLMCIPYYVFFFKFSYILVTDHTFNNTYVAISTTSSTLRSLDVSVKDRSNYRIRYHRKSYEIISDIIERRMKESKREKDKVDLNKTFFVRNKNVPYFNCESLFENVFTLDSTSYQNYLNNTQYLTAQNYIESTRNCSSFIADRGYITHHLTTEERNFPIAYSILMYKDTEQAERLLRAIYRPQNIYCIHVDGKTEGAIYDAMKNISHCLKNVFVLKKRVKVIWGEMSVLEPELLCMRELLTRNKRWKYFINLTGQEFPLKTNYELVKILKAYNGANDVEASIREFTKRCVNKTTAPHKIHITKGAVHVAVTRGFVEFAVYDQRANDILKWMNKSCYIPDEEFFTTLNHNPHLGVPGAYKGHPETTSMLSTRKPYLARFKNRQRMSIYHFTCRGKWVRGMCVYSHKDLPFLKSRKELFANKFHLHTFPLAYDCLEELIFNRTRDEYRGKRTFDASWYSSFDFVKNKVK